MLLLGSPRAVFTKGVTGPSDIKWPFKVGVTPYKRVGPVWILSKRDGGTQHILLSPLLNHPHLRKNFSREMRNPSSTQLV